MVSCYGNLQVAEPLTAPEQYSFGIHMTGSIHDTRSKGKRKINCQLFQYKSNNCVLFVYITESTAHAN